MLVLGRSGTGKTTVLVYRMWYEYLHHWESVRKGTAPMEIIETGEWEEVIEEEEEEREGETKSYKKRKAYLQQQHQEKLIEKEFNFNDTDLQKVWLQPNEFAFYVECKENGLTDEWVIPQLSLFVTNRVSLTSPTAYPTCRHEFKPQIGCGCIINIVEKNTSKTIRFYRLSGEFKRTEQAMWTELETLGIRLEVLPDVANLLLTKKNILIKKSKGLAFC